MKDSTPAIDIREKDLAHNRGAFRDCLGYLPPGIRDAVDIRYGLGGWAQELKESHSDCKLVGYEKDPGTSAQASIPEGHILNCREYEPPTLELCDLLMADFNNLTCRHSFRGPGPEPLIEAVEDLSPRYIIFTDTACARLHLNWRVSYGLSSPDMGEYWEQFPLPGYRLMGWSRVHFHASTSVWARSRSAWARYKRKGPATVPGPEGRNRG